MTCENYAYYKYCVVEFESEMTCENYGMAQEHFDMPGTN